MEFDDYGPEVKDECGVFGVWAPDMDVARMTFFALVALQHRGQESAGIATLEKGAIYSQTGMGLVNQVFTEDNMKLLRGNTAAIGHTRYSTTGKSTVLNAQPVVVETMHGQLAIAQNGNLTGAKKMRKKLLESGVGMFMESDIETITQLLAAKPNADESKGANWEARISSFMQACDGAYSLTILTPHALFAVRDFLGLRPLCLAEIPASSGNSKGYVISSETCAVDTIGGKYLREVKPGEIVRIDANGMTSFVGRQPSPSPAFCVFEYVYVARPDSLLEDQLVHQVRIELGIQLAIEQPVEADMVCGVPDSSLPAAIGYSQKTGIPYGSALIKNRYIHRTFIQPDNHTRKQGIRLKFNPLPAHIKDKRVVVIDDSIVRGNTMNALVKVFRDAGAKEVHVRVSSPPVKHPCFMGIDMATHEQLIAYNKTIDDIKKEIGADSLGYLSHEGMMKAVTLGLSNKSNHGHCTACFSGNYPLDVNDW